MTRDLFADACTITNLPSEHICSSSTKVRQLLNNASNAFVLHGIDRKGTAQEERGSVSFKLTVEHVETSSPGCFLLQSASPLLLGSLEFVDVFYNDTMHVSSGAFKKTITKTVEQPG